MSDCRDGIFPSDVFVGPRFSSSKRPESLTRNPPGIHTVERMRVRSAASKHKLQRVVIAVLLGLYFTEGEAQIATPEREGENINIGGERPFDELNIIGDFGKSIQMSDAQVKKSWWECMVRGEVGKDRFLILCALRDGNWKKLGDIRDFIEFQDHRNLRAPKLQEGVVPVWQL